MGHTSRADGSQSDACVSRIQFASSEAGKLEWSLNYDWVGNDIGQAAGKGETYGQQCLSRADCTHWTWSTFNGGTCWLKGAINATELVPATGTSCGYRVDDCATGNPYTGVQPYLNLGYAASVKAAVRTALPSDAPFFASVAQYPTALWLNTMASLDSIPGHLSDAAAQAGGKSSNGEIPKGGFDTYKTKYIDVAMARLQKKAANVRLSLVIEPDSLPNIATNMGTNRCDATTDKEYMEGVTYAIAELSQIPDTTLCLDSGFGGWLDECVCRVQFVPFHANQPPVLFHPPTSAIAVLPTSLFASGCPALGKCPLAKNASTDEICYDWNSCIDENRFTAHMNAYLAAAGLPTRWIVETSRSGRAGIRNHWGSWCNVKGAGIGHRPEADPANAPQGEHPCILLLLLFSPLLFPPILFWNGFSLGWSHAAPSLSHTPFACMPGS
ncbi:unnamed protein product [Closterium sp. NIES-54]